MNVPVSLLTISTVPAAELCHTGFQWGKEVFVISLKIRNIQICTHSPKATISLTKKSKKKCKISFGVEIKGIAQHFAESWMRRSIPLACLNVKFKARAFCIVPATYSLSTFFQYMSISWLRN